MFSQSFSSAIYGMDACVISVEVDVSDGLPIFQMVGFLAAEVKEAKERVKVGIRNSGYRLPAKRITVNLSPADMHKEGTAFDLAIACGILAGLGHLQESGLSKTMLVGELGLDGRIHRVNGVLPIVYEAKKNGFTHAIVPLENLSEALMVEGISIFGASTLAEVVKVMNALAEGRAWEEKQPPQTFIQLQSEGDFLDFDDVYGQEALKRAVLIAAAGMHNLLICGPPGSGKSMMAKRISGILPQPDFQESMEISKLYSIAGLLDEENFFITKRPFRSPHHSVTETSLVGGGRFPRPGELSLAHGGILFLDELTEFPRKSIELLRQPLEDGYINISRLQTSYRYPCRTMLVGAFNPCPCGYFPDRNRCRCKRSQIRRYLGKLSHPFLERMDICVESVPVDFESLRNNRRKEKRKGSESGSQIRHEKEMASKVQRMMSMREITENDTERGFSMEKSESENGSLQESQSSKEMHSTLALRSQVIQAHEIQRKRFLGLEINYNSQMSSRQIEQFCELDEALEEEAGKMYQKYRLSARTFHKLLKVARTIADLDGKERIEAVHLREAVSYRLFGLESVLETE